MARSESINTADPLYSPHDQLPAPEPRTESPPKDYFYEHTAKHLIKDTVRIMANGLPIDLEKVSELEKVLDDQLKNVRFELKANSIISKFQEIQHSKLVKDYITNRKSKLRNIDYYIKPFKHNDMNHRSYFMHLFAKQQKFTEPSDLLPTGIPRYPATLVKKLSKQYPVLTRLLNGTLKEHPLIDEALTLIAKHKCDIYNEKYLAQINSPNIPIPEFNPGSPQQKQALFAYLGIESNQVSKDTGLPSFPRDEIERINRETIDENIKHFTQCFIDYSFAAIVRNNFINAFYKYSIPQADGSYRLHGQYKLLGAKTGRYTSSNPNMLNAPSTGSIFSKPIKQCFTAPKGFIVAGIDYSALEDRVVANLSRDKNKLGLFLDGLDGHSLSATYYYPDRVAELVGPYTDNAEASKLLKALVDSGDKKAKAVRQDSKPISFGLALTTGFAT